MIRAADEHVCMLDDVADAAVPWSDEVDEVLRGDITAAVAYVTPAGGAVVTAVAPCGIDDRDAGAVGFTTSLGLRQEARAHRARPQGGARLPRPPARLQHPPPFVLVQGDADVDLTPSQERASTRSRRRPTRYLGELKRGPVWDRLLREYYQERVFVDIAVRRRRGVARPARQRRRRPSPAPRSPPSPPPQRAPKNGHRAAGRRGQGGRPS